MKHFIWALIFATSAALASSGTAIVGPAGINSIVPSQVGNAGRALFTDGSVVGWSTATGGGSGVTSVALSDISLPSAIFTIGGSPITTSGTLTLSARTQVANTFLSGPVSGASTSPSFRAIIPDDLASGGTYQQVLGTNGSGAFFWAEPLMVGGNSVAIPISGGTSTAQEFDIVTNGLARIAIASDGAIGISQTPQNETKVSIFAEDLDPSITRGMIIGARTHTTSNTSNSTFGGQSNAAAGVTVGFTNSAVNAGFIAFGERGNQAGDGGEINGGLVGLVAGIDIELTDATALTNIAAAIAIQNTITSGSVTDAYDIYVLPATLTGSTIGTQYGIFINPPDVGTKINYLTGKTQFGGTYTVPTSVVEVNGNLGLNGSTSGKLDQYANAVTTSYSVSWPAAQGAASTVLTNDGAGNLSWGSGAAGFATTALDNLASTAVNASILPASTNSVALGSTALAWSVIRGVINGVTSVAGVNQGRMNGTAGQVVPSGGAVGFGIESQVGGSDMGIWTANSAVADATQTGILRLQTGNKTAGTGNSGGIALQTGTSAGGTRGVIRFRDGSESAIGQIWTSTSTTGAGHWEDTIYATKSLDNLDSVAINTSLIFAPGTNAVVRSENTAGVSANASLYSGASSGDSSGFTSVFSGDSTGADSGYVNIYTGTPTGSANSGPIYLKSGGAENNTGAINITSGDGTGANTNTGGVLLSPGTPTGGGARGKIQFVDGSEGVTGQVWTSTDTSGNGNWGAISGFATTALDNLASVAINTDLLPATDAAIDLGSTAKRFRDVYVSRDLKLSGSTSGTLTQEAANTTTSHTVKWPAAQGIASSVLSNDGAGNMSWAQNPANINNRELVLNNGAEADTTGWATYADAAAATPVDGTGGSPTVTFARSTSSPITGAASFLWTKDAANRQGEGASYAFTVGTVDQARVLQVEMDYLVASGTFVGGSTGVDSDIEVYLYDVTNSQLIQPSSYKFFSNSTTIAGKYVGNFQTSSSGTSYRLILHTATTSASAYTVKLDNVSVHTSQYTYGTPITDWTDGGALIVTATTTAPTKGTATIVVDKMWWRRVGGDMDIRYEFRITSAGTSTAGSGDYLFQIPTGYSIDTTKVTAYATTEGSGGYVQNNNVGTASAHSSTNDSTGYISVYDGTRVRIFEGDVSGTNGVVGSTVFAMNNTNAGWQASFRVPIVGWASSVQMSDSADGRTVAAIATGNPASATSGNPIILPTSTFDSHAGYSTSTGRYTVSVPGIYKVYGALSSASAATTLTLFVNAASKALCGNLDSNGEATFSCSWNVVAGDIIDLRPGGTVDATDMTLNIERTGGPQTIAASELVAARYYASATSISGSLATISWSTKDYDTHGAVAAGVFTVPVAGKYHVTCALGISGTIVLNNQQIVEIQKNGTAVKNITHYAAGAQTAADIEISDDVPAVSGDTIRCQVSSGATGPAIISSNTKNVFSIHRIGL